MVPALVLIYVLSFLGDIDIRDRGFLFKCVFRSHPYCALGRKMLFRYDKGWVPGNVVVCREFHKLWGSSGLFCSCDFSPLRPASCAVSLQVKCNTLRMSESSLVQLLKGVLCVCGCIIILLKAEDSGHYFGGE